jgi:hypothetical protein
MAEVEYLAERDGDGYSSRITWHDNIPPFETREEAEKFIESKDNGWYDDHAVRFKDYSKATKTTKILEYEAKIEELRKAGREYRDAHSIHNFKAKFVGCPRCESRLNKEYIVGERCNLCSCDLRSKTTTDKIKWYEDKIKEYYSRIEAEKTKQKKNCQIMWLVKIEYHS